MHLPLPSIALVLLATAVAAQQPPASAEPAAAKKSPLQKLVAASAAERPAALIGLLEDQIASGAVFAGQYAALRDVDGVRDLLIGWLGKAPAAVADAGAFRVATINALRDVVDAKSATDELKASLKKLASSYIEPAGVRQTAGFALAQLGDRSLVDKDIERATTGTAAKSPQAQAGGWNTLANIHYNLREYDKAAVAYGKLIAIVDSGAVQLGPTAATLFYNAGCTLALAGKTDDAFAMVERALKYGKAHGQPLNRRLLETDMDIASLRKDERFAPLIAKYFGAGKGDAKGKDGKDGKDG